MDKLVSIVLPVYNGERFLAQSIESVLNQTYKNLELIVVNDCSTDGSEEIVLKYKAIDARVKYYRNDVNLKLPKSLNRGFSFAKGDYYTWTSDDNFYDLTAIEKMVDFLENDPGTDMVCCDYCIINADGEITRRMNVFRGNILSGNNIGACFLYRKEIAEKVGEYNPDLFLVEDYDYWIRIFLNGKIDALHEFLYFYRQHEKTLTFERKQEVIKLDYQYKLSMLPVYEKANLPKNLLFGFFDAVSSFDGDPKERRRMLFGLYIKHPFYFIRRVKRKIKDVLRKILKGRQV